MRSFTGAPRSPPGLTIQKPRKRSLHTHARPHIPICEEHGVVLEEAGDIVDETLDIELKDGRTLLACPKCYGSPYGDIDSRGLADDVVDRWDQYREHFETDRQPIVDK